MSQGWIYFIIGYFFFSLGIIVGCLIMMRGDETTEESQGDNQEDLKEETKPVIKTKTG